MLAEWGDIGDLWKVGRCGLGTEGRGGVRIGDWEIGIREGFTDWTGEREGGPERRSILGCCGYLFVWSHRADGM